MGRSPNPGLLTNIGHVCIAVESMVGNGRNTLFWTDHWLHGSSLESLAPNVVHCVPFKFRKNRTMHEALQENRWVSDIKNALGWLGLAEYLELWDLLPEVNLSD